MAPRAGNRREKRISAAFPIRLWGMDATGHPFIEASTTVNVSRSGVLLRDVPAKLTIGDVIGLNCNGKKHRFQVVWVGTALESGRVGLKILDSGKWIWDDLRLPPDDVDIYARPPISERRLVSRVRCFLSAEVICDGAGQKALAFVRDLSLGGCYVAMTFPFPLEAKVSIAMWLDEQVKIWADGIVISSHPSTGMGVKFLGLSRANLALIEKCVKELSQTDKESGVRIWIPGTKQDKR